MRNPGRLNLDAQGCDVFLAYTQSELNRWWTKRGLAHWWPRLRFGLWLFRNLGLITRSVHDRRSTL